MGQLFHVKRIVTRGFSGLSAFTFMLCCCRGGFLPGMNNRAFALDGSLKGFKTPVRLPLSSVPHKENKSNDYSLLVYYRTYDLRH